jgi:hypothetical protein
MRFRKLLEIRCDSRALRYRVRVRHDSESLRRGPAVYRISSRTGSASSWDGRRWTSKAEHDADAGSIAWTTFGGQADAALDVAVAETEAFLLYQLGDARSFTSTALPAASARRRP